MRRVSARRTRCDTGQLSSRSGRVAATPRARRPHITWGGQSAASSSARSSCCLDRTPTQHSGRKHHPSQTTHRTRCSRRDSALQPEPGPGGVGDPGRRPSLSQGCARRRALNALVCFGARPCPRHKLTAGVPGPPPNQRVYPNGTIPAVKNVYIRYVRKARHRFGAGYYLVPAGNINTLTPVPARCRSEQTAALQHELPRIPTRLRKRPPLALESRFIAQQRHNEPALRRRVPGRGQRHWQRRRRMRRRWLTEPDPGRNGSMPAAPHRRRSRVRPGPGRSPDRHLPIPAPPTR